MSEWPNSEVIVFGSFESGAALAGSDIDFTLATDQVAEPKPNLCKVRDILAAAGFDKLDVQSKRKRPMIVGKQSGVRFDMTIDTPEAIQHASLNTGLVKAVLTHEPARKIILLIKHWSKVQGICDSNAGTLASIGYNMISIWFLQKKNILPKFSNEEDLPQIEAKLKNHIPVIPSPCLAELLYSFFDHFADKRNYKRSVMSLRDEHVDLQSLGWDIPEGHYFPIQDPFSSARDIGRGVNKKGLAVMVEAFQVAKTKLFAALFVEYPELEQLKQKLKQKQKQKQKQLKQKQDFISSQSS